MFDSLLPDVLSFEIKSKIIIESGRPQKTEWRICVECRIPKDKNTQSEYVIHFYISIMAARTHINIKFYVHLMSCYSLVMSLL